MLLFVFAAIWTRSLKPLLYITNTLHLFILRKRTDANFDSLVFTTGKVQFIFREAIRAMTTRFCDLTVYSVLMYNKPTRCNFGSIVFINNYKYALHVSDALYIHHQEHYKL